MGCAVRSRQNGTGAVCVGGVWLCGHNTARAHASKARHEGTAWRGGNCASGTPQYDANAPSLGPTCRRGWGAPGQTGRACRCARACRVGAPWVQLCRRRGPGGPSAARGCAWPRAAWCWQRASRCGTARRCQSPSSRGAAGTRRPTFEGGAERYRHEGCVSASTTPRHFAPCAPDLFVDRCERATLTQSLLRRACKLAARRRVEQTNPGEVLGRVGSIAPARDAAFTQSSGLGRSLHGSRIAPLHFIY
jgi:hypothetical protein